MVSRNKKKLLKIILGNLSNAILHEILAESTIAELREHYFKEAINSFEVAIKYRQKLSYEFSISNDLKSKLIRIVKSKLRQRIKNGYNNLNLNKVEIYVESLLKKIK